MSETSAAKRVSVRRNPHSCARCLEICVDGHRLIYVSKNDGREWKWKEAQINWSAIGTVSIEDAEAFAHAMKVAIREAKKLDRKYPPGSDFKPYWDAYQRRWERAKKRAKSSKETTSE